MYSEDAARADVLVSASEEGFTSSGRREGPQNGARGHLTHSWEFCISDDPIESRKPRSKLRNRITVNTTTSEEVLEVLASSFARERAALEGELRSPARRIRVLRDCPEMEFTFTPWLEAARPDTPDMILVPTTPDISPLAQSLESAILDAQI